MCTLKVYSQGWTSFDFRAVNALGDTIPYLYTQGDSTSLTVSQMINQTSWYKTDSLVIPEIVTQDNKNYIVKKISTWCFANGPEHVKKLHLPKTYNGLDSATLSFVEDYWGRSYEKHDGGNFNVNRNPTDKAKDSLKLCLHLVK